MLKRSFAEFHAQRAQPEVAAALLRGQQALARLRSRPWPRSPLGTTREEAEVYYRACAAIEVQDSKIQDQVAGSRGAQQALTNGRVVLVEDERTGVTEVGVVVDSKEGGGGGGGGAKKRTVLALRRLAPEGIVGDSATTAGAGAGASVASVGSGGGGLPGFIKPGFGKKSDDLDGLLLVGKGSAGRCAATLPLFGEASGIPYLLSEVPARHIVGICTEKLRLNADAVLSGDPSSMAAAVAALTRVAENAGAGDPPLLDPVADLKLNGLKLVTAARERARLAALRSSLPLHRDPLLPEMLAIVRSEALLARRMAALAAKAGDAGLAQLPEFHQRVAVLQGMGYLEEDRTVTMKGRVCCEVRYIERKSLVRCFVFNRYILPSFYRDLFTAFPLVMKNQP
jgi:antiviral helicase SKI2